MTQARDQLTDKRLIRLFRVRVAGRRLRGLFPCGDQGSEWEATSKAPGVVYVEVDVADNTYHTQPWCVLSVSIDSVLS